MKYTGTTYRPPVEHDSLLLQVTVGCAHNRCTFCSMYRDVGFQTETIDQIEKDLKEARTLYRNVKRVFLLNGDAFVLSYNRLKEISAKIIEYFPEIETITMYSSVHNIMDKTDEELILLKEKHRINDLYVGLETGNPETLANIKKGHNIDEAVRELTRLDKAGISYVSLFMLGIAGKNKGSINAKDTSDLINIINPKAIWFGTLAVYPGSPLAQEMSEGEFKPATELEILNEEKEIINLIDKKSIPFYGVHPTNVASVQGILSKDKETMIRVIDELIQEFGEDALNKTLNRFSL